MTRSPRDAIGVRVQAPAKVNLCLFLGPPRADGRHELVTLFESVSLYDELAVSASGQEADEVVCPGVRGPNLVSDALAGLRARGWQPPPLRIEITKRIPVAAGMGGGSADAAALLRLAPELAPVEPTSVRELAAELGADVPSQLDPGVALGTGAGEIVDQRPPLAAHALLIVPAAGPLSTAAVYAEADRLGLARGPGELAAQRQELERALRPEARLPDELLINDLEPAARSLRPEIAGALQALREAGAEHALVCGSGPTVAGLFWDADATRSAEGASRRLRERFADAVVVVPVASRSCGKMGGA